MYKFREFTILLVILGGTLTQDFNVFDVFIGEIPEMDYFALDNTTESGLSLEGEQSLLLIRSLVCPQDGECSGLLGCHCDKQFEKLGRNLGAPCTNLPCRFMDYLFENLANMIRDFEQVSSFSMFMRLYSKHHFPIFQEFVCQCNPNLSEAMANCALGYDSEFVGQEVREEVRNSALNVGKKDLKRALLLPSNMFCVDNESCVEEFAQTLTDIGSMLDNSTKANSDMNECYNFRRLSDKIIEYVRPMFDGFRINPTYDQYLTMLHGVAEEFWCGKVQCAGYLDNTFNTCCAAKASSMMGKKELESVLKLVKVAYDDMDIHLGIASEKSKKKVLEISKPEKLCEALYEKKTCE